MVDDLKKTMKQKPFLPVDDQSVYSVKYHLPLEVENAKLVRVVERVQVELTEALEANLRYKVS